MKASHLALVTLVLGLAVGFAIGAVLNGPESAAATPLSVGLHRSVASPPIAASDDEEAVIEGVGELPSTNRPSTSTARSSTAPGPSARSAARKAVSFAGSPEGGEDAAAWTHKIHGVVLDADGEPMPGVQIVCLNGESNGWRGLMKGKETAKLGRAWDGLPDVETVLAEQAEKLMRARQHASTTVSGAGGRFTLENLREGVQSVQAHAEGFEFAPQTVHTGRECTFVGERVVELELDVRLPDGTQPESAVVLPGESNYGAELAWSPEEPRLRLKESAFELIVRSGNVQRVDWRVMTSDYESEPRMMNMDTEGAGPHVVSLRANQILRVQVEDASDLVPQLPVWVKVTPASERAGDIDWSDPSHAALAMAPTGAFEVTGMASGKYVVAAGRGEGNAAEVAQTVTMGEGITEASLGLGEADLTDFLVVRCSRADGTAIDRVEFEAAGSTGRLAMPGQLKPQRRARGEYWLSRGQLFRNSEGGTLDEITLTASTVIDGAFSAQVSEKDRDASFEFKPACSLEVQVGGDLTAGYTVQAKQIDKEGKRLQTHFLASMRSSQKVQEDGRAVLNALQPGRYEITLQQTGHDTDAMSFMRNAKQVAQETVEVTRAGQQLELTVPARHTVTVHAEGLEAGRTLQLSPKSGGYRDMVITDVGPGSIARFENVFEGEYTLRLKDSPDSMAITVPTGQVQFVVKIINALKVRTLQEGGPAALAGFQKGDLITEISGKSVTGWNDMMQLMRSAATDSVQVTVLRGQQSTGLSIGPLGEENGKPRSMGMSLNPESK